MSNKWVTLTDKIISLTNKGLLDWNHTADENIFQTVVGDNAIQVEFSDFNTDTNIIIRDIKGSIVDKFSDLDLSRISGNDYEQILMGFLDSIRRKISGADEVLDDVLEILVKKELDDEIPF